MKQRRFKIFIGLREVAGYFSHLNKGFTDLGITSCFFQFYINKYYSYGTFFMRFCQFISSNQSKNRFYNYLLMGINLVLRTITFIWAICCFNVFIFEARSSFFKYKDLGLLKKLRKKIIYVFLGSDSRPDYLNGGLVNDLYIKDNEVININECIKSALLKRDTIVKIEKYADYCIEGPSCAMFHRRPYIKWLYIGFPFPNDKNKKMEKSICYDEGKDSIKILHAPSNPKTKGTQVIREIINRLKNEGVNIEYIEIINKPNSIVLELLSQCDFVVDELYSDTPLGGLGTEAAFSGKPTINGGYYSEYIEQDYNKEVIPPSIFCEPQEIEEKIRHLISEHEYRRKLGRDAYNFVMKNWEAKEVASRYLRVINNDIPKEWMGDPYKLNYIYGYGQSKEQTRKIVDTILAVKGKDGLALVDKPSLMELLLK